MCSVSRCPLFLLPLVVAALTALAAGPANGEPDDAGATPVELSWVRLPEAQDCPPAAAVRADVERRLGRPLSGTELDGSAQGGVSIEVLVSRRPEGFRADIEMRGKSGNALGSRAVTGDSQSCASLGAAAALAVSIMLRPLLVPPKAEVPPVEPSATEPKPPPVEPTSPRPAGGHEAREEGREHPHVGFALGGVGAFGVLPVTAFGLESSAELALAPRLGTRASVTWLPPRRIERPVGTLSFGATIIGLSACYDNEPLASIAVRACAGPFVEALTVAVERPRPVGRAWHWSGGARAGVEVEWVLGSLGLTLGAHALVPLRRWDYLVRHAPPSTPTSFFRQPAASGLALLGLRMPGGAR